MGKRGEGEGEGEAGVESEGEKVSREPVSQSP